MATELQINRAQALMDVLMLACPSLNDARGAMRLVLSHFPTEENFGGRIAVSGGPPTLEGASGPDFGEEIEKVLNRVTRCRPDPTSEQGQSLH